jgi:hypothetical protein
LVPSEGVEVGGFDVFGLDARVAHGDVGPAVTQGLHDHTDIGAKSGSLMMTPGFAQAMAAVVFLEADTGAPAFDQTVNMRDRDCAATLAGAR